MAKMITIEVVTPEEMVLSEEVEYVGAPGINGEFGILPGHVPLLSALGIGSLYYKQNGRRKYVFIAGGFAEVLPEKVVVLAEVAEKAEEIDLERARKARELAEQRMRQAKDNIEYARARAAMARALYRLSTREASQQG